MPRRNQFLVCQYLENISRDALAKYQDIIREYIRGRHGIYALFRRNKLYYVGLAGNLRGRIKTHLKDHHGQSWDRFSVYLTIGNDHLRELESLLLRIVRPSGNRQIGRFHHRCQNLRSHLTRELRRRQREELHALLGRRRDLKKLTPKTPIESNGRGGILQRYIDKPLKLRRVYKGKTYRARVRSDGMIRCKGTLFRSPSSAGKAICNQSVDGWYFWSYERAPGDWVRLNELRRHRKRRVQA